MKTNFLPVAKRQPQYQTTLGGFIFRRLKPITRAIALAQCLAVILAAPAATAQIRPVATVTNATVSTAEVTAFMQSFQQDPNTVFKISLNPKRVPLLLAAIEREPAGRWVNFLQAYCFRLEHAAARKLPPARRSEVYARAIEYLTAARATVSKALQADPRNRQLKDNLGTLDVGLALAYVESGTRTKEARALAEAVLALNTVTNWNYGNLIYNMHSLLGRIALREGDVAAAKRHLAESGKTSGSPPTQLVRPGPRARGRDASERRAGGGVGALGPSGRLLGKPGQTDLVGAGASEKDRNLETDDSCGPDPGRPPMASGGLVIR